LKGIFLRTAACPRRLVEAVEDAAADFVQLKQHGDSLPLIEERLSLASVFRVDGQGLLELIGEDEKLQ